MYVCLSTTMLITPCSLSSDIVTVKGSVKNIKYIELVNNVGDVLSVLLNKMNDIILHNVRRNS